MGKSFDEFGLDEFLCPDEDAILYLKGTYLSPEFNFIRFSVDNCNNGYSDTVSWNVVYILILIFRHVLIKMK